MLATPMASGRRMPMASSWKLKRTLRRKKSLGSMRPLNRYRLAVALAVGVVHRREQVRRPRQLELHDHQCKAGMTLEDAGEDQIAQRQRRVERLCRAAAGVAPRLVAGP